MTIDPIERAARALVKAYKEIWPGSWPAPQEAKELAGVCVAEHKAWLTEQGIPIDKLLSGEMVPKPVEPADTSICLGALDDETPEPSYDGEYDHDWLPAGKDHVQQCSMCDMVRRWPADGSTPLRLPVPESRRLAQLDYAGGQVVTPEDYHDILAPHKPGLVTVKKT